MSLLRVPRGGGEAHDALLSGLGYYVRFRVVLDCPPEQVLSHWSTPPEAETKHPAGTPLYRDTAEELGIGCGYDIGHHRWMGALAHVLSSIVFQPLQGLEEHVRRRREGILFCSKI